MKALTTEEKINNIVTSIKADFSKIGMSYQCDLVDYYSNKFECSSASVRRLIAKTLTFFPEITKNIDQNNKVYFMIDTGDGVNTPADPENDDTSSNNGLVERELSDDELFEKTLNEVLPESDEGKTLPTICSCERANLIDEIINEFSDIFDGDVLSEYGISERVNDKSKPVAQIIIKHLKENKKITPAELVSKVLADAPQKPKQVILARYKVIAETLIAFDMAGMDVYGRLSIK